MEIESNMRVDNWGRGVICSVLDSWKVQYDSFCPSLSFLPWVLELSPVSHQKPPLFMSVILPLFANTETFAA